MTEREKALADVTLDLIDVAKAHRGRALMPGVIDGLIERATDALALPAGAASPPGDAKEAAATLTGHPAECVCGICLVAAASWTAGVEEADRRLGAVGKSLARLLAWVPTGMCNCQGDYVCPYHEASRALAAAPPPPGTAPRLTKEAVLAALHPPIPPGCCNKCGLERELHNSHPLACEFFQAAPSPSATPTADEE